MKNVLFSITIPAYKGIFLAGTIESCLGQLYQDFELIVVDDASPEDLQAIVSKYGDKRIRFYRNEVNYGSVNVVDNWNKCLSYCKGDYVICIGDDDRLKENCLTELKRLMELYPNLDAYHAQTEIIDENSEVFEIQAPRPLYESAYSVLTNRWCNRTRQYLGDFCYKVSKLRELGGYYKLPLGWASDDITAVMMAKASGIANTQIPCFQYRVNHYSISRSADAIHKLDAIEKERQWYNNFLKETPTSGEDLVYHKMALSAFGVVFLKKQENVLRQIIKESNNSGLIKCFQNRKKYRIKLKHLIKLYLLYSTKRFKSLLHI